MKKVETLERRTKSSEPGKIDSLRQNLPEQLDEALATLQAEIFSRQKL